MICQLKPSGASTGWMACPIIAARLWLMAGPSAPALAAAGRARNQISTIIEKIVVPAR